MKAFEKVTVLNVKAGMVVRVHEDGEDQGEGVIVWAHEDGEEIIVEGPSLAFKLQALEPYQDRWAEEQFLCRVGGAWMELFFVEQREG